jgi:integrase
VNFQEQSQAFLTSRTTRNRKPAKPSTLACYKSRIEKHVLPAIGTQDLASFGNGAMKAFAQGLTIKGLGPKTVLETVTLVKLVVASAVSEDGDLLYPRQWNNEFIDLPPVVGQKQPTVTTEQIIACGPLGIFLAGTGLRIGEALACRNGVDGEHTGWSPDRSLVDVQTQFWRGREGLPKTFSGIREVDLTANLNTFIGTYVSSCGIKMGELLFPRREKTYAKQILDPAGVEGFHTFRRFRITHLRGETVPDELIRGWVGHAGLGTLDRYSKLMQNLPLRKTWAEKAGLGFELNQ